jgi:prepilin-type N-terminal cleavage/methylation domain-containing protein
MLRGARIDGGEKGKGFTIVELLIVIVVIGILTALAIGAYAQAREKARQAKIDTDLTTLGKAIKVARVAGGDITMLSVTGSVSTGASCWNKPSGTDLSILPSSDVCWIAYKNALSAISNKSGTNINGLVDPWGYPYFIDENEQEYSATPCRLDIIGTYKRPTISGAGNSLDQSRTITYSTTEC